MAHPVLDLKGLLASGRPVSGRVVAITGGMVRVATAQGVVEVSGEGLSISDRVTIRNGKAIKIQGQQDASLHFV